MIDFDKISKRLDAALRKEIISELGFKGLPHYTVTGTMIFELGRNRHLSIGSIGTPNEMLFICEVDNKDNSKVTDAVCLHNYDYDGYLTKEKLQTIINVLTK